MRCVVRLFTRAAVAASNHSAPHQLPAGRRITQTYLALRNGLVALYRRQPARRLTVEDACAALHQYDPTILQR